MPSVDPQSRDLSIERPFSTKLEGTTGNIGLTATVQGSTTAYLGRAFGGAPVTWSASNLPFGSIVGAQLIGTTTGAVLWETFIFPFGSASGTVPFTVPAVYRPALQGPPPLPGSSWLVFDPINGRGSTPPHRSESRYRRGCR